MISEELRAKIVHSLKTLNPYKIILFGSCAYGTPKKDSDIDIVQKIISILDLDFETPHNQPNL